MEVHKLTSLDERSRGRIVNFLCSWSLNVFASCFRKYLSKHGGSQQETAEDSAAQSSKQELDCSEADNQANALLERRNQQERDTVSGERDSDSESESSSEHFHENVEDADSRREVMLRAVQRRLQQQ